MQRTLPPMLMAISHSRAIAIFLSYAMCSLILHVSGNDEVSISFIKFDKFSANLLSLQGDAAISGNAIALTNTSKKNGYNDTSSLGRTVYKETIPLWSDNFTTHFRFLMEQGNRPHGEGFAFFFASQECAKQIPFNSQGGGLGIFGHENHDGRPFNGGDSYNQIVAIEFDTYMNKWDTIDNPHVGIDVQSIVSRTSVGVNQSLNDGEIWDAWIDYNGKQNKLLVFLSNASDGLKPKGINPLLSYNIDLKAYLPENVMIGFSAVAYNSTETHQLISWSFNSSCFSGSKPSKNNRSPLVIIMVCVVLVAVIVVCFAVYRYIRRRRLSKQTEEQINKQCDHVPAPRIFTYGQLSAATMKFSEKQKLGRGGFGDVYKGVLVKTNEIVAVKRLTEGSRQGEKEYVSEITTISRLRHRNLLQLLGWCHEKGQLLLVYEYMSNGSLDNLLFGNRRGELDWARRHRNACDIASALFYLHELCEECVVHRDVKSGNIMLDSQFNAKLGDFRLARLVSHDGCSQTTTVAGTVGYMAPEYAATGKATAESDVFSFGAVALEIACGRKVISFFCEKYNMRLVEWVWDLYGQGRLLDAADSSLKGEFDKVQMEQLMVIGLWCSHPDPATRPKMRQVLQILNFEVPMPHLPRSLPAPTYSPLKEGAFFETGSSKSDFPSPFTSSSQELPVFPRFVCEDTPSSSTQLFCH